MRRAFDRVEDRLTRGDGWNRLTIVGCSSTRIALITWCTVFTVRTCGVVLTVLFDWRKKKQSAPKIEKERQFYQTTSIGGALRRMPIAVASGGRLSRSITYESNRIESKRSTNGRMERRVLPIITLTMASGIAKMNPWLFNASHE